MSPKSVLPILLALLCWLPPPQSAADPNIELSADERAWLEAGHRVRVRVGDHPPWEINSPEASGMAVDYLRIIGERFGIDFHFVPAADSWIEGFEDMAGAHRQYDLLPSAKRTDDRLATLAMSEDYLTSPWTIFTREDTQDIHDLSDLRGRTVAVERGYVMQDLLASTEPAIVLSVQDSTKNALLAVSTGNADAYVGNLLVTDYQMQALGIVNLKMAGPTPFGEHKQAMVARKEWAPLISLIDKGLQAIPAEQHIAIRQHWLASVADGGMQALPFLSQEERAYLDATRLRRALASAWTPFDFADADGTPSGVAEDYWTLIRDKLGLHEDRAERRPFPDILAAIERGDIDLYAATTRTADRERYALFSDPYERYPIAIAGAASAGLFPGTASLEGRRVAVGRDYSAYHLLKGRSPGIDFVLVDDTRAALEAVADGRADVAVDILPVLNQQIEDFPKGRVKLVGVTDVEFPLQVMVGRQQSALVPLINRAIAAITPEERAAIHNKWLLRQVVSAPDYTLMRQVLVVALLILAMILFWNQRLRREVRRRQQAETELLHAKDAADRANRAKGDFLANMSHEIRTPLNAVIGLTRLSLETKPAPALRDYLDKIDLSARTLLALISDVLDLSRLEADKLQPRREPFALDAAFDKVRMMLEQQAADKGLALRIVEPEPPVGRLLGDELRLTQVLLNLLGNAIKFTPRGTVTLTGQAEDEDAQGLRLRFTVTDTGIGIPESRRAELFEAFSQIDSSSTRDHGGSGLGLAISARLVALMGGRLQVESVEGQGSRFWFSLRFPRAAEHALSEAVLAPETTPAPAPGALRGKRVLVAEDDPVNQLLLRDLLRRRGAEVRITATGAEAVAAATADAFDIVLMDIRMPEMDGLEACRRIRALRDDGPPIIALTANALAGERERCLAAGMNGYLTKPLDPDALYAELCRWLQMPPAASSNARAEPPPGFDRAKIRRLQDASADAWPAMVRTFVAGYPETMAAIGAALDRDDRARAGDLLHRLRGSAGALGADDLSAAAKQLETALANAGPLDSSVRDRFVAAAEVTAAGLTRLQLPSANAELGEDLLADRGERHRRMGELEALLEAGNTRALDHLPWLQAWVDREAPEEGCKLLQQIETLDFPAALNTLRALRSNNLPATAH